jgi:uncharacterized protein (TIGR03083 family)
MALPVTDTRPYFRPLCDKIVALLRSLEASDWERPTVAGRWRVRDVTAHMADTALRRLSHHRDRARLSARQVATGADLVALINDLNASWVLVAERWSPRVLTDVYARAGRELADFFETLSLDDPAPFPVSWAGQATSPQWLDIGREFTEVWHHGAQIREAVGAGPFDNPAWLRAVLAIAMHVLPHAYRDVYPRAGTSVVIEITGPSAGTWTAFADGAAWDVQEGSRPEPAAKVTMMDGTAWKLLFNALPADAVRSSVRVEGDAALAEPLLRARSVIV